MNAPEYKYWPTFCEILGLTHLANDPRYATTEARETRTAELMTLVDAVMITKTRDVWLKLFQARKMLFVPIQDVDEVVKDPQALINGYMVNVDHPNLGNVNLPGFPIQFSANRTSFSPAPERGQHTDLVLADIGYGADEIAGFKQEGIIK